MTAVQAMNDNPGQSSLPGPIPGPAQGEAPAQTLPLVVDLDGTLLLTDTLFEATADRISGRRAFRYSCGASHVLAHEEEAVVRAADRRLLRQAPGDGRLHPPQRGRG